MTNTRAITPVNEGEKSERDSLGRFVPGHGMGRPKGSKNVKGVALSAELWARKDRALAVIDAALERGEVKPAIWLLSKFVPDSRIVELATDAEGAVEQMLSGELSSAEAQRLATIIGTLVNAEETRALDERLKAIEDRYGLGGAVQ